MEGNIVEVDFSEREDSDEEYTFCEKASNNNKKKGPSLASQLRKAMKKNHCNLYHVFLFMQFDLCCVPSTEFSIYDTLPFPSFLLQRLEQVQ